jgi:hypothetical protein
LVLLRFKQKPENRIIQNNLSKNTGKNRILLSQIRGSRLRKIHVEVTHEMGYIPHTPEFFVR